MSTIVAATLPADQFALSETLARRPGTAFEAVGVVADGSGEAMPFLRASGEGLSGLPAVLAEDPSTRTVDVLTAADGESLFRVAWADHVRRVCDVLAEGRGALLAASGTGEDWTFRVLFRDRDAISATHDTWETYGVDVELERICDLSGSLRPGRYGLTESQYETIVTAFERGYYDVPRETTLADLAAEIEVSHQALSERLRRGHGTLVERSLRPGPTAPFQS